MTDYHAQYAHFCEGVRLLGGSREAARELGINERTINRFLANSLTLKEGLLRDMASSLRRRSEECQDIARQILPEELAKALENWTGAGASLMLEEDDESP